MVEELVEQANEDRREELSEEAREQIAIVKMNQWIESQSGHTGGLYPYVYGPAPVTPSDFVEDAETCGGGDDDGWDTEIGIDGIISGLAGVFALGVGVGLTVAALAGIITLSVPIAIPIAAAVIGACALIMGGYSIYEAITGENALKSGLFNGNEKAYNNTQFALTFGSLLLSVLLAPEVIGAIKAIGVAGSGTIISPEDLSFSDKFNKPAYKNQVSDRGWTLDMIADTINNPIRTSTSINKYTGNPVTYYYIDDITGKIIQVADMAKEIWN